MCETWIMEAAVYAKETEISRMCKQISNNQCENLNIPAGFGM